MIKLIEIYEKSTEYDAQLQRNKRSFGLRDVFINPRYVVWMQENESLKATSERAPLVPELNQELDYTQIMLMTPGQATKNINVVGDLESIANICEVAK